MTWTIDEWRSFLARWSQEWADAWGPENAHERDEEARRERRLGFAPASEERIAAAEERLGHRLPPSYRTFLRVSDGWRHAGGFVWLLAGTEGLRRHEDAARMAEFYQGELGENSAPEEVLLAGMWQRALQLDVESDLTYVLLDPGDVGDDGEWAVYCYASWRAAPPERYPSFRAFMEAMHQEFHRMCVHRLGPEFVNATTEALDASVDEARREALRGRHEAAEAALNLAVAYGRPRAVGLRDQIRRLSGQTGMGSFGLLLEDPRYAPELLPVIAAEQVGHGRPGDRAWTHLLRGAADAVRETGEEILRRFQEGTFRYTAEGSFGRAVEEARELARWGDADAAWHVLRAALPEWQPLGPDHLAPLGLLADPLLGPLCTPERGRELLATPRAGQRGDTPVPAPDLDPPGLAWLSETGPGDALVPYRFLLVEGVDPAELPARAGADDSAVLNEPMTSWETQRRRHGNREVSTWDDRALVSVGRAGPDWSFAFEPAQGRGFDERRFVSPAVAASPGTRALVVWSDPAEPHHPGVFHLSVAENGEERYAFTVRKTAITKRGDLPDAFDPDRLFPQSEPLADRLGERRTLEALASGFGVRLPRHALTRGRLHTFTTRSWSRPPAPGEPYAVLRFERRRSR
jgi:cell wall assembly regulator SMI1/tellurite resistance protein